MLPVISIRQSVRTWLTTLAVFCGVGLFGVAVSPAWAVEYGGVGGRPAYPRSDNPRTESIFIHEIEPGGSVQEGVKVINNTPEKKTLLVYATDSVSSSGGGFACAQKVDEKKSVGNWIELSDDVVTLESLTFEEVPFSITVPESASPGEHNGCIVIQEKKEVAEGQGGIQLSFRTALRVAVTVPGEITRKLEIEEFVIQKKPGGFLLLHPKVKNVGNVSVDAEVKVLTRGVLGKMVAEHGDTYPILPGGVSEWNLELKRPFWGGLYRSQAEISYETETLKSKTVWFWSLPSIWGSLIILGGILAFGGGVFSWWVMKKRQIWITQEWLPYTVGVNDDIKAVAQRYGVSWDLLAKANKITAPYVLKVGHVIQVPPLTSRSRR